VQANSPKTQPLSSKGGLNTDASCDKLLIMGTNILNLGVVVADIIERWY
jgi:hypothetical protein